MHADDEPSLSDGAKKGGTSLPKFNHLYPMLFFGAFIRFCGAQKCGGPLSSADGTIEGIKSLDDTDAVETAAQSTPTRAEIAASTPAPRRGARAREDPPHPDDINNAAYRAAVEIAREAQPTTSLLTSVSSCHQHQPRKRSIIQAERPERVPD